MEKVITNIKLSKMRKDTRADQNYSRCQCQFICETCVTHFMEIYISKVLSTLSLNGIYRFGI